MDCWRLHTIFYFFLFDVFRRKIRRQALLRSCQWSPQSAQETPAMTPPARLMANGRETTKNANTCACVLFFEVIFLVDYDQKRLCLELSCAGQEEERVSVPCVWKLWELSSRVFVVCVCSLSAGYRTRFSRALEGKGGRLLVRNGVYDSSCRRRPLQFEFVFFSIERRVFCLFYGGFCMEWKKLRSIFFYNMVSAFRVALFVWRGGGRQNCCTLSYNVTLCSIAFDYPL